VALLRRGAWQLAGSAGAVPAVDADFVASHAAVLALRIERDGLASITGSELRPRLRPA
jgi:hypothetical protein